jgi:hypothetical protein
MEDLTSVKQVYLLDSARVHFYWPQIESLLAEVPGFYDYYTSEWIYSQINLGHLHVWALDDGAIRGIVISQIAIFPKQKVFDILAIGGVGTLQFFEEMQSTFEKLAISCGCTKFAANVRPGLARKLKTLGAWTESHRLVRPVVVQRNH